MTQAFYTRAPAEAGLKPSFRLSSPPGAGVRGPTSDFYELREKQEKQLRETELNCLLEQLKRLFKEYICR